MNQEIKDKLEQAAETAWEQDQKTSPSPVNPHAYVYGYKAGAQTILDNPQEWFPPVQYWQLRDENERLQSQLSRYRAALEDAINIVHSLSEPIQELIDVLEGAYYEGK